MSGGGVYYSGARAMHYLIQKTTRQHIAVADDMPCPVECVKVRADAEGWVKHSGAVRPVPAECLVDVRGNSDSGFVVCFEELASRITWDRVTQYRLAHDLPPPPPTTERAYSSAPRATSAPGHETAAMLLSIICAFAIGALIGWGWM